MPLPAFPGLDCECGEGPASSPCRGDGAKVEDMSSLAFLLSSSTVRLLSSRQQPTRWGRRIPPPLQMRRPKAARDEGGPPSRHGATESKPTSPRHSGHRTPAWSPGSRHTALQGPGKTAQVQDEMAGLTIPGISRGECDRTGSQHLKRACAGSDLAFMMEGGPQT